MRRGDCEERDRDCEEKDSTEERDADCEGRDEEGRDGDCEERDGTEGASRWSEPHIRITALGIQCSRDAFC